MSAVDVKLSEALAAQRKLADLLFDIPGIDSIEMDYEDGVYRFHVSVVEEAVMVHVPKWYGGHNVFCTIMGDNFTGEDA